MFKRSQGENSYLDDLKDEDRDENHFTSQILSYDFQVKAVENSVFDLPVVLAIVISILIVVTISYVCCIKTIELVTKTPTSKRNYAPPSTIVGVYFQVLRDAFGR